MKQFLSTVMLMLTLCSLGEETLDNKTPKEAFDIQQIMQMKRKAVMKRLLHEAQGGKYLDIIAAYDKLHMALAMREQLDETEPKTVKLVDEVLRAFDDVRIMYYEKALKKEGALDLLQYRGEWLKRHETKPWILVKHLMTPPENLSELDGYIVKDGRCLGQVKFIRAYKDFSIVTLSSHWSRYFLETSGAAFKDEALKGAQIYGLDERHHRALHKLTEDGVTTGQVLKELNPPPKVPPPPKPIHMLRLDGKMLSCKGGFMTTQISESNLTNKLEESNRVFAEPMKLFVDWKTAPAMVDQVKDILASGFKIKKIGVKREKQPNKTAGKLTSITFSKVNFQETRLSTVLEFMQRMARNVDPAGEGVNLLYLPEKGDDWTKEPNVTMTLENNTLEDCLKKLCKTTGLKYRVENHAVILGKALAEKIDIPMDYQRKYHELVFPKISFMDTRLKTVFEFITMHSKKLDPYRVGIPLSVTIPKPRPKEEKAKASSKKDDEFAGDFGDFPPGFEVDDELLAFNDDEPTISLDLDYTPVLDVLRYVCYLGEMTMAFENGVIVVKPMEPAK